MVHGCVAQLYLCVLVSIAVGQSAWWFRKSPLSEQFIAESNKVKRLGLFVCGLIFVQLIVGAIMRHSGAGLAIPTFPLTPEGGILPEVWNFRVAIHFAHRVGALVIFLTYLYWASRVVTSKSLDRGIKFFGWTGIFLLFTQVSLGAMVIWTFRSPIPTTVHVIIGAFLFAITWLITFCQFNSALSKVPQIQATSSESIDFPEVTAGQSHT